MHEKDRHELRILWRGATTSLLVATFEGGEKVCRPLAQALCQ
jgi:hypothetical protein